MTATSRFSASGMHPWGKWGRNFVEYGVVAAQAALADAGVAWRDVQFVSGADTMRNGYPGYVAGATFAQALGWNGAQVASSYAACASGVTALATARAQILAGFCDVALVIGADTTPKGFLAPNKGERGDDPDWLRFRLLGATNPTYFGLYARRRMELFGATREDFARVKVKNAQHGLRERERALPQGGHGRRRARPRRIVVRSARPARHLRDERRRGRARRELARVRARPRRRRPGARARDLDRHAELPADDDRAAELRDRQRGRRRRACPSTGSRSRSRRARTTRRGSGPTTSTAPRCTTCRPRWSSTGTSRSACARRARPRNCVRDGDTTIGGRIPVNPSGGLACFGEAVPAQAIAQVCELTWQVQGRAGDRQVERRARRPVDQPGPLRPRLRRHRHHVSRASVRGAIRP